MKMIIKKVVSTFLTGILVFSFAGICFAGETVNVSEVKIDERYQRAVSFLMDLGVLKGDEEGNLLLDNTVTRAEISAMIIRILGYENVAGASALTSFKDIDSKHWAAGDIAALTSLNIINGFGDGMFYPENTVTIEQATKMLVCSVGHDFYAQEKGTYPGNYMSVASELGILDGVDHKSNEELTRAKVALLIYNTLFVDVASYDMSSENTGISIKENSTLLTSRLHMAKAKGIITGTDITKLSITGNTLEDCVEIGGKTYYVGTSNAELYLGYNVEFYYDTKGEENTIVSVRPYRTNVIDVKSDDLVSLSNTSVSYYAGNKEKHAVISKTADYIYNGKADLTFEPNNENVYLYNYKLVDNNNDNIYDVVFVNRYKDILVSKADAENHKIYDKLNQSVIYEFIPGLVDVQICLDGELIGIQDIRQNDVLSISYSKDKKFAYIDVSRNRIAGKISNKTDDKYCINDEYYELSESFPIDDILEIGYAGTFYLNNEGKIVSSDIKQDLTDGEYGYLINFGSVDDSDEAGDYTFQIFTVSGKIVIFNGSDNMRLNGERSFNIRTDLFRRDKDGNIEYNDEGKERKDQLIKYRVDSENNITEIKTAKYGYHENEFSMTGTSRVDEYRPDRGRVGGYGYTDSTIFMRIPSLRNKDKFALVNQSDIQQGSSFNIEVFDCNEVNFAKVILIKTDMATTAGDIDHLEPITIVTSVGEAFVDDEVVYTLTGWRDGQQITLYSIEGDEEKGAPAIDPKKVFFNTDKTIKDLKPGDIIQYGTDAEGRMDRFKFLFGGIPSPQIDVYENGNEDAGLRNNILFNTVARRNGDYIVVNRSGGREIIFDVSKARNVYVYDEKKNMFNKASQNDIIPDVTVFIHQNEWSVIDVVIYPDGSLN